MHVDERNRGVDGAARRDATQVEAPSSQENTPHRAPEPIAIVGIGCRFPGASSPDQLWSLIAGAGDAVREITADRWNADAFHASEVRRPGRTVSRWAGLVDQRFDEFDHAFFGMSPREAAHLDPMHRWLLEVTWEAFEDGGYDPGRLAASRTGVFVGVFTEDAKLAYLAAGSGHAIGPHTATGTAMTMASNRISYAFDLRGPSVSLDTACSSSLVAVHLACQSLWAGESDVALAGGANFILLPENTIAESRAGMLSPDGRCKVFDARANGYVRGEGAGIAVLTPLSRALARGDRVRALIHATAVNQDGRTNGITVPSAEAQKTLIREACARAGVAPGGIGYVEAHGTGTPVGDPIEARALSEALSEGRAEGQPCRVGSVKANIGHLEAAAGIAGLAKAALCVERGLIPPQAQFRTPNPAIPLEALRLRVPTALERWPEGAGRRLAAVNSFGFGGTNAHVIVGAPPAQEPDRAALSESGAPRLLLVSGHTPEAMRASATALHGRLGAADRPLPLGDVAYTLATRRAHHAHRAALVASSTEEARSRLAAIAAGERPDGVREGRALEPRPRVTWVCSGMGPQWWGMGRELLASEPAFREALEEIDVLFREEAGWSLVAEIGKDENASRMAETQVAQPANFALQVGLAAILARWGVVPDAIVGHSAGEIAAGYLAGAMTLRQAVNVIYHRSRLQHRTTGLGQLLAVEISLDEVRELIEGERGVSLAAVNGPSSVTLVGDAPALGKIADAARRRDAYCRVLKTDVPYHSHYMEDIRAELLDVLAPLAPTRARTPLYSTVTGERLDGVEMTAEYWWRNVREPVFFAAAVSSLRRDGFEDVFLELSPHPVLASSLSQCLQGAPRVWVISTLNRKRPERAAVLEAVASLHVAGVPLHLDRAAEEGCRFVRLPTYPWQRKRCWGEPLASVQHRTAPVAHPLLGRRMPAPTPRWRSDPVAHDPAYLDDHRIDGAVVYPGAAFVEMAAAAGRELAAKPRTVEIEDLEIGRAAFLGDDVLELETSVREDDLSVEIHGRAPGADGSWVRHASCRVRLAPPSRQPRAPSLAADGRRALDVEACYRELRARGFWYGPRFQNIVSAEVDGATVLARIRASDGIAGELERYAVHPAVLDACFQALLIASFRETGGTYLPVAIRRVTLAPGSVGGDLWVRARVTRADRGVLEGDIEAWGPDGDRRLVVEGVRATSLEAGGASRDRGLQRIFHRVEWIPSPDLLARSVEDTAGTWAVFCDAGGVGRALADRLRGAGATVVLVQRGETFRRERDECELDPARPDHLDRLLDSVAAPLTGLVQLWPLDFGATAELTPDALGRALGAGPVATLHAVQAAGRRGGAPAPRVWLVTRGSQAVTGSEPAIAVGQSPAWGFATTVLHQEGARFAGGLVDLDPARPEGEADVLAALVTAPRLPETHVALRGGTAYAPRLRAATDLARGTLRQRLRPDRTYLVTGGLGGLGLVCARWLVQRGARHVSLVGRSGLPPRASWASADPASSVGQRIADVRALEALGARVRVDPLDVADEDALRALVGALRRDGVPVAGAIHAAGVAHPRLVDELGAAELLDDVRAKVQGGWSLHRALADELLDWFVLFSSVASLGVSMGMAAYSAGNAFLDALAAWRRSVGLQATSVGWGAWSQVGMSSSERVSREFVRRGFLMIDPELGMDALERLLEHDPVHSVPVLAEWPVIVTQSYPEGGPPLVSELATAHAGSEPQGRTVGQGASDLRARLHAADAASRAELIANALRHLVSTALGMEPAAVDPERPLVSLGMDSMMAVELRGRTEAMIGASPSIVELLRGASVASLAASLAQAVAPAADAPQEPRRPGPRAASPAGALGAGDDERARHVDP